jgi:hypothetical protein
VETLAEQEGLETLLGGFERQPGGIASAREVADGLVLDARYVNGGEIAGAQPLCDLEGIPTVGLDLVAGSFGDQGGSDDTAVETLGGEVSMQDVPRGAGLVRENQGRGLAAKSADELVDIALTGADGAEEVGRIGLTADGVRDRDRVLVDIQTDEKRSRLVHG